MRAVVFRRTDMGKAVGEVYPPQLLARVVVCLWGKFRGVLETGGVEAGLIWVARGGEGHRRAASGTEIAANSGRRAVDLRRGAGPPPGGVAQSEPCGERRRGLAATGFAMAMTPPKDTCGVEGEAHGAAQAMAMGRGHGRPVGLSLQVLAVPARDASKPVRHLRTRNPARPEGVFHARPHHPVA